MKIHAFIKKYWEIIVYLVFGCITTLVNYAVYLPLYNALSLPASICNAVAWVVAVLTAYVTNKPFVFHSNDWSFKVVVPEFVKFLGCRVVSGVLETAVLALTVDILHWNGNIMKLITSVAVVIANYVGSKLLVFKAQSKGAE